MRVAYFTDTYAPEVNGVANTLTKLSGYLEGKGVRHAIFAPDYEGKPMDRQDLLGALGTVHRFQGMKVHVSPNSCLAFPSTKTIFDLCDQFVPDLVHVTTEFGIGYKGMKYATSRKLPLVMSYHTDYCKYLDYFNLGALEPLAEKYLEWFYSFSQKTLVPSKYTMEQLVQKNYQNIGIWSRGIDTGKFGVKFRSEDVREELGIGDRFAFLYVGRLSPEKGLHMLLHAIPKINSLFPGKAAFVFTGDGPYAETIRQAGFDNVRMTGFKTGRELARIYASCDCFSFPSGTETFGNAPLEAMASGLPVLGVNSGGVTEFLSHGYNSLLCEDGEQDAFADLLIRVMQNRQLHRLLAINAQKTALTRNWDDIFDRLLCDYQAVIQKNAVAPLRRAS